MWSTSGSQQGVSAGMIFITYRYSPDLNVYHSVYLGISFEVEKTSESTKMVEYEFQEDFLLATFFGCEECNTVNC